MAVHYTQWYWLMENPQLAEAVTAHVLQKTCVLLEAAKRIHTALQAHPNELEDVLHAYQLTRVTEPVYAEYTGIWLRGGTVLLCLWNEDSFHIRAWPWGEPPGDVLKYEDGRDPGYVVSLDWRGATGWQVISPPEVRSGIVWVLEQLDINVRARVAELATKGEQSDGSE